MRRTRFLFLILISASAAFAQDSVTFDFAVLNKGADGTVKNLDYKQEMKLTSENRFQFYVNPVSGFVYLILIDAQDQVSLLYPDYSARLGFVQSGAKQIPDADRYFTVDAEPGVERFYLLGSKSRLTTVEDLVARWIKAASDNTKATELSKIRESLQNEIARLVYEAGPYSGGTEKPHSFGGVVRGMEPNAAVSASRITAEQTYARTIRLKH